MKWNDFPQEVTGGIAGYDKLTPERKALVGMIVDNLDKGTLLWHRNWVVEGAPVSAVTGRAYRGVNNLTLTLIAMQRGYKDNRWATFNQIKQNGWTFKQKAGGETLAKGKGVIIEFFEFRDRATKQPFDPHLLDGMSAPEKEAYINKHVYPLRRAYTVFNADLLKGLPDKKITALPDSAKNTRVENLLDYWDKNMSRIIYGGDEAYYNKAKDEIHIPDRSQFVTYPEFYSTSLHELSHSTGHVSRLDRNFCGFGTPEYAMEELRAELASMFLSQDFGVRMTNKNISNNSAYIKNWVTGIRENTDVLFKAIADAERIARYVHMKEKDAGLYDSLEWVNGTVQDSQSGATIYMPPAQIAACEGRSAHTVAMQDGDSAKTGKTCVDVVKSAKTAEQNCK